MFSRLFGASPGEPRWIEIDELRARLGGADAPLVVDVRGADEFTGPLGHIEGARNVPLPELPAHMPELVRADGPVVVVCLTDKRSSQAAAAMTEAGIKDVTVLRGGMKAWRGVPWRAVGPADSYRAT
jgi:rhodanese-related sulfurtransferase